LVVVAIVALAVCVLAGRYVVVVVVDGFAVVVVVEQHFCQASA